MTKNPICAKEFLEIIVFSQKFKESRTNLNPSKPFKNFCDLKKIKYY